VFESIRVLLTKNANPELKNYQEEFEKLRTVSNNKRCELLTKALLFLNLVLLIVDLLVYKPMWAKMPPYLYLYYSHLTVLFIFSIWLVLLKAKQRYNWNIGEKTFNNSLLYLVIGWCTFMGLNSTEINGQISAYIVCILCIAAFFYLKPIEVLFTYCISLVTFAIGLVLLIDSKQLLYSNLVNVFITIILAQIGSIMNYSYFAKDFLNKKSIMQSKLELEVTNQKLKEYENLRTDFLANISHELRTPLNVIYSAKQMVDVSLKENNFDIYKINKYLKMIAQNTYRLLRLINNLIDITKIDACGFEVKPINTDIVKIVEDITLSVADYIESKGITLTFDTEVEEQVIVCDPDKIERVILNLLSNAVKFTELNGDILVNVFIEESNVCISVKDTGIGIPEDMQNLIFDRFIQVDKSIKRTHEGSGIGLALVKSLVEMHGGKVSVKSKLGEGSEFIITLPVIKLTEVEEEVTLIDYRERHIERINIEFSDIYR
jgi:two-component system, OmpR family, phosphate regulon sensor histidine kinase PhoR